MEVAIKELYTKIQSDLQMVFFTQSEESEESDIDTTTPNNPRECLMIIFNSIRDLIILKRNFFHILLFYFNFRNRILQKIKRLI